MTSFIHTGSQKFRSILKILSTALLVVSNLCINNNNNNNNNLLPSRTKYHCIFAVIRPHKHTSRNLISPRALYICTFN